MRFLKYLSLLAFTIVLILSCQQDNQVTPDPLQNEARVPTLDEILEGAEDAHVTVEHATLEEVNAIFTSLGLPTYTQEYIDKLVNNLPAGTKSNEATLRSCETSCSTFDWLADWNGSSTVTAYDVALSKQYCCNNGGGCSSPFELDLTSGGPHDIEAWRFAAISLYTDGICANDEILSDEDMDQVTLRILGYDVCEE